MIIIIIIIIIMLQMEEDEAVSSKQGTFLMSMTVLWCLNVK